MHLARPSPPRKTGLSSTASSANAINACRVTTPMERRMKAEEGGNAYTTPPLLMDTAPRAEFGSPANTGGSAVLSAPVEPRGFPITLTSAPSSIPDRTDTSTTSNFGASWTSLMTMARPHETVTNTVIILSTSTPTKLPTSTADIKPFAAESPAISTSTIKAGGSNSDSASVIGGAAGGSVALLLLAGIVILRLRRRRTKQRLTVNDVSIVNDIVQYPSTAPIAHIRKGERTGVRVEDLRTAAHAEGSSNGRAESPVLDVVAASAMFKQLERFLRSLHADHDEQRPGESASVDDRASDSLPEYSQVADM